MGDGWGWGPNLQNLGADPRLQMDSFFANDAFYSRIRKPRSLKQAYYAFEVGKVRERERSPCNVYLTDATWQACDPWDLAYGFRTLGILSKDKIFRDGKMLLRKLRCLFALFGKINRRGRKHVFARTAFEGFTVTFGALQENWCPLCYSKQKNKIPH